MATVGLFYLPESPRFLMEQNRISDTRDCLEYIARINGVQFDSNKYEVLEASFIESPSVSFASVDDKLQVSILNRALADSKRK